jgi:beta-lactam-binding protein with PASTA domain
VGKLIYKPWKYDNLVIEQYFKGKKIKPGEKIEKGSYIDLVLGRTGDGQNTSVPNLVGMTRETAEQKISEMMLNVGSVFFDDSVIDEDDSLNAVVVKQNPGKNVSLVPGSEIDIWLSLETDSVK